MSGESSTSKIRTRLVPSWVKRATSSSSKGISSKAASTSAQENVEINGHSLPPPGDVPGVHSSAKGPPSAKTAFSIAFPGVQQKSAERRLCGDCANLISVFDEPVKTVRDTDKEGASHINHHGSLNGLLECSAVCPICALIVNAVPCRLVWFLWGIVRDVVKRWYVLQTQDEYPLIYEWSHREWKLYLETGKIRPLSKAKSYDYPNWTKAYLERVRLLDLSEDIPLDEVLAMIPKEMSTQQFQEWTQVIRIRDQYAMKGQFADFALFLQADKGGLGLRTISSGNLRIATSTSKQIPSHVEIRLV
jgi:hypothetical protein